MAFLEDVDWSTFWSAIGAIATVFVAILVWKLQNRSDRKKEAAERQTKKKALLVSMKAAIIENAELVNSFIRGLEQKKVNMGNVELSLLEATAAAKYDLLDDIPLCTRIDDYRSTLRLVHNLMTQLLKLEVGFVLHGPNAVKRDDFQNELRLSTIGKLQSLVAKSTDLDKDLQKAIDAVP